ncbi:MAG TPA: addiction module protein [Candidatus Polarisedimenticolaceae bacterium]|nr:addiction module protein [Candidatus Polarisedimenticolaceae bacterium]
MSREFDELLREALSLPADERSALAGALIDSLDTTTDPDAEVAWIMEIARRNREIDEGTVLPIPWAEARRRLVGQ